MPRGKRGSGAIIKETEKGRFERATDRDESQAWRVLEEERRR